jgi:hypothetical protein
MDYADLQPFLMGSRIQSNANGNYSATLASYFFSKNYNYNILQFAGKVLDNVTKSKEIKDQFIGNRKFNTSEFSSNEIPQKMVTWLLDTTPSINAEKAKASNDLVKATQDFFKQNEDFFYIFGGDRIVSRLKKKDAWKISRMEVKEIWKKVDGVISFDPVSVQLYVNDSALAEIPYRDMVRFNIQVGLKNWVDYLREKPFQYTILLINNQEIARREAFKYLKALQIYDWNKVTEYVKFY